MPQFQLLPESPGFGSQLGRQLGGGISQGIGSGLQQMFEQKTKQQKLDRIMKILGVESPSTEKTQSIQATDASIPQASLPAKPPLQNLTPEKILAVSTDRS